MGRKLITHAKGETVDNIVDNIMAELFDTEKEEIKYWINESATTGHLWDIFKLESNVGYYYKNGKWQEHYDLTAKDTWESKYKSIPSDEIEKYLEQMTKQEYYYAELSKKSPRELNAIISLVQSRVPKEEANLKDEVEEMFFDSLEKQAEQHVKEYGFFPTYELCELD